MSETNNVFISWSGARSKAAAEALRTWLPVVLQSARPWMSDTDIEKGSRGLEEVGKALEGVKVGIICLTPENLTEPWIHYEAGALSKTLDARTRVCTYLLAGLRKQDVKPPLGLFQATEAQRDETIKLVHAVNNALEGPRVPKDNLNNLLYVMWPQLEEQLASLPPAGAAAPPKRSLEDMVAEVLELSREGAKVGSAVMNLSEKVHFIGEEFEDFAAKLKQLQIWQEVPPPPRFRESAGIRAIGKDGREPRISPPTEGTGKTQR
jgi:TIR domain-containing protein